MSQQDSSGNPVDKQPDQPDQPEGAAGEQPESPAEPAPGTLDPAPPPAAGPVPDEPPLEQPPGPAPPPPTGPPPPGPEQAAPRKRRTGLIVVGVVAGVLLLGCLGMVAVAVFTGGGDIPEAGDCLTDAADANDMDVVDCGAGDAAWSVLGEDQTMTRGEFSGLTQQDQVCQAYPETQQALWVTEARFGVDDSTEGKVICLQRTGG